MASRAKTYACKKVTSSFGAHSITGYGDASFFSLRQGVHTIIITATDQTGAAASRILTFSRAISAIDFALTPTPTAQRARSVTVFTSTNAESSQVQVCNNANDPSPTWEDVVPGEKYTFTNETSSSGQWAFSARFYAAPTSGSPFIYINRFNARFTAFQMGTGGGGGDSFMSLLQAQQQQIDELTDKVSALETGMMNGAQALNPTK